MLGLLGDNGAGKTTAIRILTTLSRPTEGTARVAGHDVVGDPAGVRASIGVAAQAAAVDGLLTAQANLEMLGRLYGMSLVAVRETLAVDDHRERRPTCEHSAALPSFQHTQGTGAGACPV